jgi:hypothetical protein
MLNYDEITIEANLKAETGSPNRVTTLTIIPSKVEFPTSAGRYILHIADTKASTWNAMACEVMFGFNSDTELNIQRTVLGSSVTDRTYGISHVYGKKYVAANIGSLANISCNIPKFVGTKEYPIDFSNLFEEIGNETDGWYTENKVGHCIISGYINMWDTETDTIKSITVKEYFSVDELLITWNYIFSYYPMISAVDIPSKIIFAARVGYGVYWQDKYAFLATNNSTEYIPTEDYHPATKKYVDDGLNKKQNTLTFDTTPTSGSGNPVTSGGIYTALSAKVATSSVLTKTNTTSYTPTANYHPATKKYVDDKATSVVIGTYTGDGETAQTITLGFTPKAVLVTSANGYLDSKTAYKYGNFAINGYESELLEIVENGFVVKSSINDTYAKSNPYKYIAFK